MSANENKNNDCVKIGDFNVGEITIGGKKDDKKNKENGGRKIGEGIVGAGKIGE